MKVQEEKAVAAIELAKKEFAVGDYSASSAHIAAAKEILVNMGGDMHHKLLVECALYEVLGNLAGGNTKQAIIDLQGVYDGLLELGIEKGELVAKAHLTKAIFSGEIADYENAYKAVALVDARQYDKAAKVFEAAITSLYGVETAS